MSEAADDELVEYIERLLRQLKLLIPLIGQVELTLLDILREIAKLRGSG